MTSTAANSQPSPIPEGKEHAMPYLIVRDAKRAIAFYQQAFGARETMRIAQPDGRIGHAELSIGRAEVMLADEFPEHGHVGPQTLGGSTVTIKIYVADVDAFVSRAESAGAKIKRPPDDQFYGDRNAILEDTFGHRWNFASCLALLTEAELQRRAAALLG
jgi:PhnB protein